MISAVITIATQIVDLLMNEHCRAISQLVPQRDIGSMALLYG